MNSDEKIIKNQNTIISELDLLIRITAYLNKNKLPKYLQRQAGILNEDDDEDDD